MASLNSIGFADFHSLVTGTQGNDHKLAWKAFTALAWPLWTIRSKLLIAGIAFNHPADLIYKMFSLLQPSMPLGRLRELPPLDRFLTSMHTRVAALRRATRQDDTG